MEYLNDNEMQKLGMAVLLSRLSSQKKRVLGLLVVFADQDYGSDPPSQRRMGRSLGMRPEAIAETLVLLEEAGLVRIVKGAHLFDLAADQILALPREGVET